VTLPGENERKTIPLRPRGAKYATKDPNVAEEVAREILARAVFATNPGSPDRSDTTIGALVKRYLVHAEQYYRRPDGRATQEVAVVRYALKRLVAFCAAVEAEDFGPLKLKEFQEELIGEGKLCRAEINRTVIIVRRLFKWAVGEELIPSSTLHALQAVDGLKRGRTEARETEPVGAVAEGHVYAVLPYASTVVGDMIQVQLLTGMRSGELTAMRTCDIETSGKIWHYRVVDEYNKTSHHGYSRVVALGPKAQEIVSRYLRRDVMAYLFSPEESERQRLEKLHAERKTPLCYGNRPGTNRKDEPDHVIGERYDTGTYRKAVQYAVLAANRARRAEAKAAGTKAELVPMWSPHQLRHTALTRARKEFGLEASSTFGGHKNMNVTEIYAEKNMALADRVAARLG
jgi:integrase